MDHWKALSCILIICFSVVCLFLVSVSYGLPMQRDFRVLIMVLYSAIMVVGMMATLWARLKSKPILGGNKKHVISYVRIFGASVFLVAVLFMDILAIIDSILCIPSFFRLDCKETSSKVSELIMLFVKIIYLGVQTENLLWLTSKLSAGNGGLSTKGHLVNVAVNVALLIHNLIFECRMVFQVGHDGDATPSCLNVEGHHDDVIIAGQCFNGTTYIPTLHRQAEGLLRPMMSEYFFLTSSILINQLLAMNGRSRQECDSNGESIQENSSPSPRGSEESSEGNDGRASGSRKNLAANYGSIVCNWENTQANLGSTSGNRETLQANYGRTSGNREILQATYGSTSGNRETLQANLGSNSGNRETLQANYGSTRGNRETLQANCGRTSGKRKSLPSNYGSIVCNRENTQANLGSTSGNRETLQDNCGRTSGKRKSLPSNYGSIVCNWENTQANLGSTSGNRETLQANYGSTSGNRETLQDNCWRTSGNRETLQANYGSTSGKRKSLPANCGSTVCHRENTQANLGSTCGNRETLQANSGSTSGNRETLQSNYGSTSGNRETLQANCGRTSGKRKSLPANCGSIVCHRENTQANLGSTSGNRETLQANYGRNSGKSKSLPANCGSIVCHRENTQANLGSTCGNRETLQAHYGSTSGNRETLQSNYGSTSGNRETLLANCGRTSGKRKSLPANYGSIVCHRENTQANLGSTSGNRETLQANYGRTSGRSKSLPANYGSIVCHRENYQANLGSTCGNRETLQANYGSISGNRETLQANYGSTSSDSEICDIGGITSETFPADYGSINDDHWSPDDDMAIINTYAICVQNSSEIEEELLNEVGGPRRFIDRDRASTSNVGDDAVINHSSSNADSFRNPGGYGFYISLIVGIASILLGVAKMSHKWIITFSFDMINTGIFLYLARMLIIRIIRAWKINTDIRGNHYTPHINYGTWLFALSSCGILTQNFIKMLPYFEALFFTNIRDKLLEHMTRKDMYEDFTLLYAHFILIIVQFSSGIVLVVAGLIYALLLENDMETCYFYRFSPPSFRVELYRLVIWSFAYWAYRSFVAVNQAQLNEILIIFYTEKGWLVMFHIFTSLTAYFDFHIFMTLTEYLTSCLKHNEQDQAPQI